MRDLKFCRACGHRDYEHGDRAIILCAGGWSDNRSMCDCKGYVE